MRSGSRIPSNGSLVQDFPHRVYWNLVALRPILFLLLATVSFAAADVRLPIVFVAEPFTPRAVVERVFEALDPDRLIRK